MKNINHRVYISTKVKNINFILFLMKTRMRLIDFQGLKYILDNLTRLSTTFVCFRQAAMSMSDINESESD